MLNSESKLIPALQSYISGLEAGFSAIPDSRKSILEQLSAFLRASVHKGESVDLVFICTHNSRRSHLGQAWAMALGHYYGISPLSSWSGGTEATAFNSHAVEALRSAGFEISRLDEGANPKYEITFALGQSPFLAWSKIFSDPANPSEGFCAIMTCSDADEACPYVPGAAKRISLPFEDPKASDGSGQEAEVYSARSRQIATELAYAFEQAIS